MLGLAMAALTWMMSSMSWAADAFCTADCNADGTVAINELLRAVNIALGEAPLASCERADRDENGDVGINELINGVSKGLMACP
jgi:Ca2+-binding EF-hand superfamily protein